MSECNSHFSLVLAFKNSSEAGSVLSMPNFSLHKAFTFFDILGAKYLTVCFIKEIHLS